MSQRPWSGWTDPAYHQPPAQLLDNRSSAFYQKPIPPYAQPTVQSIHPFYGTAEPAPIIAELPAPLPAVPPTTTSEKQLTEDGQLARKLSAPNQQVTEDEALAERLHLLEVQEAGKKYNNSISQPLRPASMVLPSPQWTPSLAQQRSLNSMRPHSQSIPQGSVYSPGLVHQQSTRSLRPHSQSLSGIPWNPGSFGSPPQAPSRYSMLPEVVPDQAPKFPPSHLPPVVVSDLPEVVISNAPDALEIPSNPASLASHLEEHRHVPYPPQWRLGPVVKMYHAQTRITAKANWLDVPMSSAWSSHRRSEDSSNSSPPTYVFSFKKFGGSYRDPRFSWVMLTHDADPRVKKRHPVWSYELRLDLRSGVRKKEVLNAGGGSDILTTYVHASNYDSLRFVGNDAKTYLWVSQMPVSSTQGQRYDIIRHALFVAHNNYQDPLYGDIVADHTYWDGFDGDVRVHEGTTCMECQVKPIVGQRWNCKTCPDHDICGLCHSRGNRSSIKLGCKISLTCLPDETLYIRSPLVDHALVIASLQVLKDWQKHELRRQKSQDPKGFMQSEETARKCDLGKLSYWRGSDFTAKHGRSKSINGRMETAEAMQNPNGIAGALGNLADAGLAMAAQGQQGGYGGHHGGHHSYGGDGGGGGGDGGGGGG
ncbi:hypothetical protein C7974DRAFT_112701 [Boeremia exigua]|uniref:uncharacterized protein n=1 Tax=Boeremia exigua TaxID=749465 RepID=UPI001E8CF4FC|nr:uncharacterized protein C7974DRAFT_112701 [Boeremia exigua]KAH6642914.1 hypothetical protein C7974DRAFT_112701 [Boeremia exigua]